MNSHHIHKKGIPSSDILAVSYFSDGNVLNSTFWLSGPFNESLFNPRSNVTKIAYGIMIDVNFDDIPDFRVELQKFKNRNWAKIYREFEPIYNKSFSTKNVANKFYNYERNFSKTFPGKDQKYVALSVDLNAIGDPKQYQFFYYSEVREEVRKPYLVLDDFTKWAAIPPPKIESSLDPHSVDLRPNEERQINLRVNSTTGYESHINIFAKNSTKIKLYFDSHDFKVPSFGTNIIPFKVKASDNAKPSVTDIPIFVYSSISPKVVYTVNTKFTQSADSESYTPPGRETINQTSILTVEVKTPYTILEQLGQFNESVISLISGVWTFLIGILTLAIPLAVRTYRNRKREKLQKKLVTYRWYNRFPASTFYALIVIGFLLVVLIFKILLF